MPRRAAARGFVLALAVLVCGTIAQAQESASSASRTTESRAARFDCLRPVATAQHPLFHQRFLTDAARTMPAPRASHPAARESRAVRGVRAILSAVHAARRRCGLAEAVQAPLDAVERLLADIERAALRVQTVRAAHVRPRLVVSTPPQIVREPGRAASGSRRVCVPAPQVFSAPAARPATVVRAPLAVRPSRRRSDWRYAGQWHAWLQGRGPPYRAAFPHDAVIRVRCDQVNAPEHGSADALPRAGGACSGVFALIHI